MLIAGGFSRCGNPLIILPDTHLFFEILESDLHMVLKYFIQIIPMAKQVQNTLKLLYEEGKKEAIIQLWSESYCDDKSFFYSNCQSIDWAPAIIHCQRRCLHTKRLLILYFWLRQELKESQSPFLCPFVILSILITCLRGCQSSSFWLRLTLRALREH